MDHRFASDHGLPLHQVAVGASTPPPEALRQSQSWAHRHRRWPRWFRGARQTPNVDISTGTGSGTGTETRHGLPSEKDSQPHARSLVSLFQRGGILRPFRLIGQDLRNLRARYVSDWAVFNQLVFASAVYVFFTNILPGITFASDLDVLTGQSWGTIEVVFSTGLCGLIFSLFSAQPLTILGVTGPFSVLAENIYSLCIHSFHIDFLQFMAWSLIHAAWMHVLLAVFNAHDYTMRYVTHFSADIFSLLNSVIYFQKAVLELQRNQRAVSMAGFLYSIIGAAGTCLFAVFLSTADKHWAPLFGRIPRMLLTEYAAAISIIFFIGVPHIGDLATLDQQRLSVQTELRPTSLDRSVFLVRFWELPARWSLAAVLPGAIITVLFFFDHEISSIICTLKRYGVRKPGGFAWDIVLLGTTTAMCGILGIPPANGLLPQAPLHSESLMHTVVEHDDDGAPNATSDRVNDTTSDTGSTERVVTRVYEQRYSSFLQSALILAFISPPLQRLLGLTPTSVLAGLFLFMGYQSLSVNPILTRVASLLTPPSERDVSAQSELPVGVRWAAIHAYTITQVALTAAVFGVTLTVAAPIFPVLIIVLVPLRLLLMNRIWSKETLRWVDGWACRDGKPEDDTCSELGNVDGGGAHIGMASLPAPGDNGCMQKAASGEQPPSNDQSALVTLPGSLSSAYTERKIG